MLNPQDAEGTRKEAEGLVSVCLLQDVGSGGYRMQDLVLEFAKSKIKARAKMVQTAAALQAQYLGNPDVVAGYESPEEAAGSPALSVLASLWRSVEELLGDPGLEIASYRASLGEMESGEATAGLARAYSSIGSLFSLQVNNYLQCRLRRNICICVSARGTAVDGSGILHHYRAV